MTTTNDDPRSFAPNRQTKRRNGFNRGSRRSFTLNLARGRKRAGAIAKRRAIERRIGPLK